MAWIAPRRVPSCSRSSSRMSTLSRCTWPSTKAGSTSRSEQSSTSGTPAAAPAPTLAIRSPSTTTSAAEPSGRRAPDKAHMGGYDIAGTPAEIRGSRGGSRGEQAMAVATTAREKDVIYPEQRLAWPQTILMGLQHVMAMFGATVLVPLILGFNPNTVIFFSGIGTLIFLIVTGRKVPSYLGSSFSFIGAVLAIQGGPGQHQGLAFAGILVAGVIYFLIGVVVHFAGINVIRFLMPPVVTGTVVAVIGIALASVAVSNFQKELVTGTITFLAAAIASVYLRGFPRLLPVLIGVVVGYVVAGLDQAAGGACASAASGCHVNTSGIGSADWLGYPKLTFPDFSDPVRAFSLFWFIPIVLVAENTGHVFAIGGIMKRDLSGYLGRTFMGDGLATIVSSIFGGTGETTYAENIGVMGITRVFSISVFIVAAITAILLGF